MVKVWFAPGDVSEASVIGVEDEALPIMVPEKGQAKFESIVKPDVVVVACIPKASVPAATVAVAEPVYM